MAFGQTDPARLEGDELTRWYLRSPAEIEEERRQRAEQTYNAFFDPETSLQGPNSGASDSSDGMSPIPGPSIVRVADNPDDHQRKKDCIEQCSDLALPSGDYAGTDFYRCLHQCMGVNDYPEWRKYFPPSSKQAPAPLPPRSPAPQPGSGLDNLFPSLSNPPVGPWWLPFALPPYVPNT